MPAAGPSALDLALPTLRCPVCAEPLARADASLRCPRGHSFDVARQGYVSLLTGSRPPSGDDAAMVAARVRFLESGAFDRVHADLLGLVGRAGPERVRDSEAPTRPPAAVDAGGAPPVTVLDAGCGTGHYLAGTLAAFPAAIGVGLDSSTFALRAAARAHPRAAAVACDLFADLPVASDSADLVLDVFAPRNPAEFHRVLRADGTLVVTRPTERHLARLRDESTAMIGIDPVKEERLERALGPWFEPLETVATEYTLPLSAPDAADLVAMTPTRPHEGSDDHAEDPVEIEVSVLTTAYRPRAEVPDRPSSSLAP